MAMEVFKLVGRITYEGQQKVEAGLKSLGQQVDAAGEKLKKFGEKAKEIGESTKAFGEGFSSKIGAPLAALGGLGVAAVTDIDKAMGRLAARTDRTAQDTAELQAAAKDLWKNAYGENVDEAADAIALVDQNLGGLVATNEDVKDLAQNAFILKDAFGYDIQESTRAAGQLMQQFGLSGTEAFDMITTAAQRGGDFSGELLDTISEYSTQFANMGFSGAQMMGLFVDGAQSGIFSLDKLADATKESFLQITDGADNTKAAVGALGLDYNKITSDLQSGGQKANAAFGAVMMALTKIEDPAKRNALAIELMGTPLEDLGPQFQSFFSNTGEGLQNFAGSTAQAGQDLRDNFGTKLTETLRTLQDSIAPLGGVILDVIAPAIDKLAAGAEKAKTWFQGLSESQQNWIVYLGLAAIAIGPLITIIGSLIGSVGAIAAAIGGVGLVAAGWIVGIGLLVAALVAAYAKFDWFRNGVNAVFQYLVAIIKPILLDIVNFFKAKIAEMVAWWNTNGAMIKQAFSNVWNAIGPIVRVAVAFVVGLVKGFIDGIKNIISGGLKIVTGIITAFAALFTGNWGKLWSSLKQIVVGGLQLIWGLFQAGLLGRVFGIIKGFSSSAGGAISGFASKVVGFISGMVSKVKNYIGDMATTAALKAMYGFDRVKSAIMTPISSAVSWVRGQVSKIGSFFSGLRISLPHIKLPHFSLSGKFSLMPPSVPKLNVNWYAKGGVFGGPSVIGVGEEPGVSEAVIPLKPSVLREIGQGIAAQMGGAAAASAAGPIVIQLTLPDSRVLARFVIDDINELLARKAR